MPTIDELAPAQAASDGDLVPVSQGGIARHVTRTQLLAGMQAELAVPSGALLGRSGAGVGPIEVVRVSAPLRLEAGVLSGPARFSPGALPVGSAPGSADLVAVTQGGRDVAVPYGGLMAGLGGLNGIDLSGHGVRAPGADLRPLSEWVGDAVPVEAYGAKGDGLTDDTAAFDRAMRSGRPVRLLGRTYVLTGQWTVTQALSLVGVPGQSVLRRRVVGGGAFISIGGPAFRAYGVVFDAGQLAGDSWGVLVTQVCTEVRIERCVFQGATGATLGSGLTIQARDGLEGAGSGPRVLDCTFRNNQQHGLWVQAAGGALVEGCVAEGNGAYGIALDFNDPAFQQRARRGQVLGCRASGNQRGISIGNFNETNAEPPRWGNAHPDAVGVLVAGNYCAGNAAYGIAVAGVGMQVTGNQIEVGVGASGILATAVRSRVSENVVRGPEAPLLGQFGIDSGGSIDVEIAGNLVQDCAVGINPGGSRGCRVRGNQLCSNVWGVIVYNVETDGHGQNFGIATDGLTIEGNRIALRDGASAGQGGGIYLIDAPQGVAVVDNQIAGGSGTSPSQALWAHTDAVLVRNNGWNNQARMICNPVQVGGLAQVQVPDIIDEAMVTASPAGGIGSIVGQHQAATAGQVVYVRVTAGGTGYRSAAVTITGSGSGAQAVAHVRDGVVIGVALLAGGSGYAGAASVRIDGDGSGASATAQIGVPVPEGRRLRLHCNATVRFRRVGSLPFQDNWTGADITVPAASVVEWVGAWGGWQAVMFTGADYVAPTGDGGLVVRSAAHDVTLRPGGGGQVRIGSEAEPFGCALTLGRGSPEGQVNAPPGSDYRNLDGGVGSTLWIKRIGTGATGWFAVA